MKRELSIAFCGAGAAMLAFGRTPEKDLLSCAVWLLAFAGVRELTDKRTPRLVYTAPIAAFVLDVLVHTFTKEWEISRLTLGAGVLASALMSIALFITIVAAAPKIGPGLAGACGIGLVLSEGARIYDRQLSLLPGFSRDAAASAHHALDTIRSIGGAGGALVPVAWIALCAAPFGIEIVRSRRLLIAGAVGFGTCSTLFDDLVDHDKRSDMNVAATLFYFAGWVLCTIGAAAIARSTKSGRAWAGFVMCILQVPAFFIVSVSVQWATPQIPIAMTVGFGALGLGLATSTHRVLRWAAILFALATIGSLFDSIGMFVTTERIINFDGDPSMWWPAKLARETFTLGLLVSFAMSLLVTAPPKAAEPDLTRA